MATKRKQIAKQTDSSDEDGEEDGEGDGDDTSQQSIVQVEGRSPRKTSFASKRQKTIMKDRPSTPESESEDEIHTDQDDTWEPQNLSSATTRFKDANNAKKRAKQTFESAADFTYGDGARAKSPQSSNSYLQNMKLLKTLALVASCASLVSGSKRAFERLAHLKEDFNKRHSQPNHPGPVLRQFEKRSSPYLNKNTQKFVVNPYGLPDVPFSIGESYAGLLPISSATNETRQLFFWFFPSSNPNATDEITIWFNGGPGCSSLSGLLNENGPFTWMPGTLAPVQNAYAWTNLTNMVWVEQPVGVGYTTGTPIIKNEVQLAQEFMGFWKNFMTAFKMQNRKVYITGESYGGFYVPYVANAFIESGNTEYFNVAGIAINDPILGDDILQQEVPIVPFLDAWQNVFYLNQTFTDEIHATNDKCGYTDYINKYLTFPPPRGPFPTLNPGKGCNVINTVANAALEVNPCFNIYHVLDTCPHLYGVLGIVNRGDYSPPGAQVYFNRRDVKKALNAPLYKTWYQCTPENVFGGSKTGDQSLGPAQNGVLANVIEHTNNTIIGVGGLDFLLPTNGTLLVIQNMTWGGVQGLQSPPNQPFYTPYHPEYNGGSLAGAGDLGYWVAERGLTFYTVQLSGHMVPEYAPGAAYRMLEHLLGRIPNLSTPGDFTTQSGQFTANSTKSRK